MDVTWTCVVISVLISVLHTLPTPKDDIDENILGCNFEKYTENKGYCDTDKYHQVKQKCSELKQILSEEVYPHRSAIKKDGSSVADVARDDSGGCISDILLTLEQVQDIQSSHSKRHKRKVRSDIRTNKWNTTIYYKLYTNLGSDMAYAVREALTIWSSVTCLEFIEIPYSVNTTQPHLLFIEFYFGCSSYIGRVIGMVPQPIFVSLYCTTGTIIHEVGHALGMIHEHQRSDRDSYITINKENIESGYEAYFASFKPTVVTNLDIAYDYASVMHYFGTAFTIDSDKKTIRTKDPRYQKTIGQRVELSFLDVLLVNKAYCQAICANNLTCINHGYTDPHNCSHCRCPDGWEGTLCDQPQTPRNYIKNSIPSCGNIYLNATTTPQILTSPGYGDINKNYTTGDECTWIIKASNGNRVRLQFIEEFNLYVEHETCFHWVEVRPESNNHVLAAGGARYCGTDTPTDVITSNSNQIMILFRAKFPYINSQLKYRGFKLLYSLDGSACSSSPCLNGANCTDTSSGYNCSCSEGYYGHHCENYHFRYDSKLYLVIMLDTTYHVAKDFYYFKKISKLILLYTSSTQVRHGLINFNDISTTNAQLKDNKDLETLNNIILSLSYNNYGGTDIIGAFNLLVQEFVNSNNISNSSPVPKVSLMIVDSYHSGTISQQMIDAVTHSLKDNCIQVVVILIGVEGDIIYRILPSPKHVISIQDQEMLVDAQFIHSVMEALYSAVLESERCSLQTTTTTTSTTTTATTTRQTTPVATTTSTTPSTTTRRTTRLPSTTKPSTTTSTSTTKVPTTITSSTTTSTAVPTTTQTTTIQTTKSTPTITTSTRTTPTTTTTKQTTTTIKNEPKCAIDVGECDQKCGGCGYRVTTINCTLAEGGFSVEKYKEPCNLEPCVKSCPIFIGTYYYRDCKHCCPGFINVGDNCFQAEDTKDTNKR